MNSTGIVRKLDRLGRIVLPMEIRRVFELPTDTPLEIFTEGDSIILTKYQPGCTFCGEINNCSIHKGQHICQSCIKDLKKPPK